MIWRFNDGTEVEFGGKVEGATLFAHELREALDDDPSVALRPLPSESIPLDTNNAAHLDHWLTAQVHRPRWRDEGLKLVERPKGIPKIPRPPRSRRKPRPGVVY